MVWYHFIRHAKYDSRLDFQFQLLQNAEILIRCSGIFGLFAITPAGAGKSGLSHSAHLPPADHPRRCGEKFISACAASQKRGSPPQVRGKEAINPVTIGEIRITPAGAGKSIQCEQ